MPSQCLICTTLDFKQFGEAQPYSPVGLATDSAHYACDTTVYLNVKDSNTTYISKI